VAAQAPDEVGGNDLRRLAGDVRGRLDPGRPGVVVLVSATGDRAAFVATVNDAGRAAGLSAGAVVRALAPAVGGRGGGKDDFAQGAGNDPGGIPAALDLARQAVARAAGPA